MKLTFLPALLIVSTLNLANVYAASCFEDEDQIEDQIYTYQSITVKDCGFRNLVFSVYAVDPGPENKCFAVCLADDGYHHCAWDTGNWGDTIKCTD